MTTVTTIKRGDALTLPLNLGTDLSAFSSAKVILAQVGGTPIQITGTIAPGTGGGVTVALTSTHTAVVGDYNVEVEMSPGPVTFPSAGYVILRVTSDLNPS